MRPSRETATPSRGQAPRPARQGATAAFRGLPCRDYSAGMSRAGLLIAIDGPSGAGKGAVARAIAARLAYRHVDTGAMYRAVAWEACRRGLDLHDAEAIAAIAAGAELRLDPGISINGHDVTQAIRTS